MQRTMIPKCDINISLLHCNLPGSYAARNYGVHKSSHEVIAFTDIDCLPCKEWLASAIPRLEGNNIAGGAIKIIFKKRGAPTLFEDFDRRTHLRQQRYIQNGFAATANMLVWRKIFEEVGDFESSLYSGGDEQWCRRADRSITYLEDAVVLHPARDNIFSILRKNRRGCGGYFRKLGLSASVACKRGITYEFGNLQNRWKRLWECGYKTTLLRRTSLTVLFVIVEIVRIGEFIRLGLGGSPERE